MSTVVINYSVIKAAVEYDNPTAIESYSPTITTDSEDELPAQTVKRIT